MQTVLVLDSQSAAAAHKALDTADVILFAVTSVRKARHILLNYALDVWVCDLATTDLDFRVLSEEARGRNPNLRIVLTGPPIVRFHANQQIEQKRGHVYVPKPWPLVEIRHALAVPAAPDAPPTTVAPAAARRPRARREGVLPAPAPTPPEARYRLDEQIGEGGTGRVYRAYDLLLEMEVAVKMLAPTLVRDPECIRLLKQEARIGLGLSHKHIVRLYNLDRRTDRYLLIMEYVRGQSLSQLLATRPVLPPPLVVQVMGVLAEALSFAHGAGVLHKDITPANVLVSDDGILKVIDFGIADLINRQRKPGDFVIGTPVYMSPEQLRGEDLDVRTDVYSSGVLAHQLLTGRVLHPAEVTAEAIAFHPHPPITGLPEAVTTVLERATAFAPADRWPTSVAFGAALAAAAGAS